MASAHPTTASKALDAVDTDVLAMATASPRPSYPALAAAIRTRFGVQIEPDNLRMWLAKRHADAFREVVKPAVRNPLDQHLELVNELRDPARNDGSIYTWPQVLVALQCIDPALAGYKETTLCSWYSRRRNRIDKAEVDAALTKLGRDDLAASRSATKGESASMGAPDGANKVSVAAPEPIATRVTNNAQAEAQAELAKLQEGARADETAALLGDLFRKKAGTP